MKKHVISYIEFIATGFNKNPSKKSRMNNLSNKELHDIIGDIVKSFAAIDKKIISLHDAGNEDFTALNKIMIVHHKSLKQISESTDTIFERVSSLEKNTYTTNCAKIVRRQKNDYEHFAVRINALNDHIIQLNTQIKHVFIPILNFKQNISTLRFLTTNIKLSHGITGKQNEESSHDLINELIAAIKDIQSKVPTIAEDVEKVRESYQVAEKLIQTLQNETFPDYYIHFEEFKNVIEEIEFQTQNAAQTKLNIQKETDLAFQNINHVITNLQYHDIIRQKMEHIQNTHKSIVDELNNLNKGDGILDKSLNYLKQIPEITEIQAGQLILTNKEYQSAIDNISKKLIDIAQCIAQINLISSKIFGDVSSRKTVGERLESSIKNYSISNEKLLSEIEKLNKSVKYIIEQLDIQKKHQNNLGDVETHIGNLIKQINNKISKDKAIKELYNKLQALFKDIQQSRKSINQLLSQPENSALLIDLSEINKLQDETIKCLPDKSRINNFITDFESISEQIVLNCRTYSTIETDLRSTLENIKYYEHFDIKVEEIIKELNTIYKKLLPVSDNTEKSDDLLEAMAKEYTMKSQRDIHFKSDDPVDDEDDDNLELF